MLMPKKVKYRKQHRGRMTGKAWRGSTVSFGDYGLKAMEPCWLTDRQIEAARVAMTRFIKRGGKIWVPKDVACLRSFAIDQESIGCFGRFFEA